MWPGTQLCFACVCCRGESYCEGVEGGQGKCASVQYTAVPSSGRPSLPCLASPLWSVPPSSRDTQDRGPRGRSGVGLGWAPGQAGLLHSARQCRAGVCWARGCARQGPCLCHVSMCRGGKAGLHVLGTHGCVYACVHACPCPPRNSCSGLLCQPLMLFWVVQASWG